MSGVNNLGFGVPVVSILPFIPIGSVTLEAGQVSSSTPLATTGQNLNVQVDNPGTIVAYVALGNSGVIASTASAPVQPGTSAAFIQGNATTVAAITQSGTETTTLTIISGTGYPLIVAGYNNSGGGGSATIEPAGTSTLGGVIVPTSGNLTVDVHGNLSIPATTLGVLGVAQPDGNSIVANSGGTLSVANGSVLLAAVSALVSALPTADPHVPGELYLNGGIVLQKSLG